MKKLSVTSLICLLASCSALSALDRVYVGPLVEYARVRYDNNTEQDGWMPGLTVGYESSCAKSYYLSGEFDYSAGVLRGTFGDSPSQEYRAEIRFGYDISPACSRGYSVTPFVGLGIDVFNQHISGGDRFDSHFWYVPFGLCIDCNLTSCFNAGIHGYIGPMFAGRWSVNSWENAPVHLIWNVEVPIRYMMQCWDISLVPYARGWEYGSRGDLIGERNVYFGGKLEIGYHF